MFIVVGIIGLSSPWSAAAEVPVVDGLTTAVTPVLGAVRTIDPVPVNPPIRKGKVPEPSSLILLGAAVAGLAIWRWKSTKV
jgi:hypothetical protein